MSTTTASSTTTPESSVTPTDPKRWIDTIDQWCIRIGDAINPIMVKETRQALKSRQFVVTFFLLLVAAFGWTVVGSLSMMPQIYTSPSAPRMMIGYYALLALPMLLVVPLAAYRSLEGEIDDGTLELLSITTLSPWQIVLGKLASASLQMVLYFVALFPCLAYAYTLRGVDLPTTLLIIALTVVVGAFLTILALFCAPLSRGRTGRIVSLLALVSLLAASEYALGAVVVEMILQGNPMTTEETIFAFSSVLAIAIAGGHLLLTVTAVQLTPESENRSTRIRVSMLVLTAVLIGVACLGVLVVGNDGLEVYRACAMGLLLIWTVGSSLMVAESSVMTPRVQRELPESFLARLSLTWLTPGPGTGLVFSGAVVLLLLSIQQASYQYIISSNAIAGWGMNSFRRTFGEPPLIYCGYLLAFLVIVRLMMMLVRLRNNPRVEVGFAALVVIAVFTALIPYSIELHYNDYFPIDYSIFQIPNWGFTLSESMRGRLPNLVAPIILGFGISLWLISVFSQPGVVKPRRVATPERVQEELGKSA